MQKSQILGRFLAYNYSDKVSEKLFKFQNCDLRKFHDLPKIRNFCPPENVKFIFINKSFNFYLMTDTDYLFDKVSEQIVLTKIS